MSFIATSIAVGVAQTMMSIQSQKAMAKAQGIAQNRQIEAEQRRLLAQQSAERIEQRLEMDQAAQQMQVASKKATEARATNKVATAESGAVGISVDALDNDLARKYAVYSFGLQKQLKDKNLAKELEMEDNALRSEQTRYSINKPIAQPDYAGSIASSINTGLSIYSLKKD